MSILNQDNLLKIHLPGSIQRMVLVGFLTNTHAKSGGFSSNVPELADFVLWVLVPEAKQSGFPPNHELKVSGGAFRVNHTQHYIKLRGTAQHHEVTATREDKS